MTKGETAAILLGAAAASGLIISAAFVIFNLTWDQGWSKAISFAIFAVVLWSAWTLGSKKMPSPKKESTLK